MGSFSIWHWLVVLLVIILVFGTSKLKNIGKDLGGAIKGFRNAMGESKEDKTKTHEPVEDARSGDTQARETVDADTDTHKKS